MTRRNENHVGRIGAVASLVAAQGTLRTMKRFFIILQTVVLAAILVVALQDPAFAAKKKSSKSGKAKKTVSKVDDNPKYAAIVIDAETGQVLHEANADAIRHPASLTKMMTLYMLFDAMEKGKISLRDTIKVSPRAAAMPKTNLSLSGGERIPVETVIKALVVRSANDIAAAVGERLGETEWQFAVNMTNVARERLGMRNTTYKNASGLPDRAQVTTARDITRLALALRRDFPQYYHYFNVRNFDYGGRTYTTHNRVLSEMPGVDGLKTGYVNMSGFNLASSIKRDGYSLVAVVLGGRTGRSRDEHMKTLLMRSLRQIAEIRKPLGAGGNAVASAVAPAGKTAPIPAVKPGTLAAEGTIESGMGDVASPESAASTLRAVTPGMEWGIQVGAFSESRDAFMAAVNAMNVAPRELKGAEITVSDPDGGVGRVYRARISNMDETQARRACRALAARKESCFVFQQGPNG